MLKPGWLLGIAALACLLLPELAAAAELREITLRDTQYYLEVHLNFDKRPAYSESFSLSPDRTVFTFNDCQLALPESRRLELARIDNHLLSRISTFQGAKNLAVGFYLNQRIEPLIRYDETGYYLRFYTSVRSERVTQLATGASLTEKNSVYRGKNFTLYLVRVDPGTPLELYTAAADRYDGKTRRRQPSSFARRELADVVINGGFFGPDGQFLSTFVENGAIRATGVYPTRPMLVVTEAGQMVIGRFHVNTALLVDGQRIPISGKNIPFENGKVVVYGHRYPIDKLPQNGMYYYLLQDGMLRYYSASTSGLWLAEDVMLVATDIIPEANPLRDISAQSQVELETRITDANGMVVPAASVVGGAPMLVEDGLVSITSEIDRVRADISDSERSRTAVALTRGKQLMLVVVKEQESESFGGVTLEALAELLVQEGAYTALNLDGGGSSAIVVGGELLNMSESAERPVSNVLVLKLGPTAGLTSTSAPPPAVIKYDRQE